MYINIQTKVKRVNGVNQLHWVGRGSAPDYLINGWNSIFSCHITCFSCSSVMESIKRTIIPEQMAPKGKYKHQVCTNFGPESCVSWSHETHLHPLSLCSGETTCRWYQSDLLLYSSERGRYLHQGTFQGKVRGVPHCLALTAYWWLICTVITYHSRGVCWVSYVCIHPGEC